MNINIPPDSRDWLFSAPPTNNYTGRLWSLGRFRPKCDEGDALYFRFDGKIVARAKVHYIASPGRFNGVCHNGKRELKGWKVCWLNSSFEDLRNKPAEVALREKHIKRARLRRRIEAERAEMASVIRSPKKEGTDARSSSTA
jgi:hypothetical protein